MARRLIDEDFVFFGRLVHFLEGSQLFLVTTGRRVSKVLEVVFVNI
jgi:hypothetical protein